MPLYDRVCESCGWQAVDVWEPVSPVDLMVTIADGVTFVNPKDVAANGKELLITDAEGVSRFFPQPTEITQTYRPTVHDCPTCGSPTKRAWLTKATTVIGDECDFVQHNGTKVPIRFRSRSEFRRWLKEQGFEVKHSHVAPPGSDKSKFTSNWAASYDPYTANNVKILMERAMLNAKPEAPEPSLNLTFSSGTLSTKDARARRKLHQRRQERAQYAKPTKPLRTHEDLVRFFKESEGG